MTADYRFYKTKSGQWYIDIPEWEGDVSALQMVAGADLMLDLFAESKSEITLKLSLDEKLDHVLDYQADGGESGGGWYLLELKEEAHLMWLCEVTRWLFGEMPKVINFSIVDNA